MYLNGELLKILNCHYSKDDFYILKNTLQQCIPFIRFYNFTHEEFLDKVFQYKKMLPEELCDDLFKYKSEAAVKEAGRYRSEGKEYVVQDGDILLFRFNV